MNDLQVIDNISELLGDDAIKKNYRKQEVLDILRKFSDQALEDSLSSESETDKKDCSAIRLDSSD
jgi:hypothetical protein